MNKHSAPQYLHTDTPDQSNINHSFFQYFKDS